MTTTEWRAPFQLPGGPIELTIRRSTRARLLRLTIDPRHVAVVTVPSRAARSKSEAERVAAGFVREREEWLRHHLERQSRQRARVAAMGPARDGGEFRYRGELHRVRVVAAEPGGAGPGGAGPGGAGQAATPPAAGGRASAGAAAAVRPSAATGPAATGPAATGPAATARRRTTVTREGADEVDEIVVRLSARERRPLDAVLESWLREKARVAILREIDRHATAMGVAPAAVTIRDAKTRWGSCSRERRLSFSWRLILAPPEALETVVIHELAHLRVFGHGPGFWAIVAARRADHKTWRKWLRDHSLELHSALTTGSE